MKNFLTYLFATTFLNFRKRKTAIERKFNTHISTIDSSGVSISFSDQGSGPVVILIHGITQNASDFKHLINRLKGRFRLIALDCRGHGASGKPEDPASYGKQMVRDIETLLTKLDIDKAILLGTSMGAEIALRFTVDYPARTHALAVIASGWSGQKESMTYTKVGNTLKQHHSFGPWIKETGGQGYFSPDYFGIATADAMLKGENIDALASVFLGMKEIINLTEQEIKEVNIPVLAICGEHDEERPCLERMVDVVPDISFNLLMGRDHMDLGEDPQYNKLIEQFLSRCSSGGGRLNGKTDEA